MLLSTYDGARFLPDQLRSLADQKDVAWELRWRDDGSQDDSVSLVRRFVRETPPPGGAIEHRDDVHRGIAGSFFALLREVGPGRPVAFADQDDLWLPHKLRRGRDALAAVPPEVPALYCARQHLVDERLQLLGPSPLLHQPIGFPAALTQNVATGCTVMLNPAAVRLVVGSTPPPETLHDWWCYLLVSAAGGRVIVDPEPVMFYRQHGNNAVGAARSVWRRGRDALRRGPDGFMFLLQRHLASLDAHQQLLTPAAARLVVRLRRDLQRGSAARLRVLVAAPAMVRQTAIETLLFRLWFLFG
ncbi:glycosyltransferase family 2 protein [Rhizosaccharibacter radicis]|uniref:Glycosyltransferase family 2 protein n=1 Tax=Rhizosaccharibacter radicis TaxID=2782605 RepID=A0ABT1VSY7_9PROT|nr:glycosyltransferase family 2 protein [Acetobacteraceae bacterium KSS12]